MEIIPDLSTLLSTGLREFQVKVESRGPVIHMRFDAFKKDGVTPAVRFIELLLEPSINFENKRMRWRTGYLYNERAIFRIVPLVHRKRWRDLAVHALKQVQVQAARTQSKANEILSMIDD